MILNLNSYAQARLFAIRIVGLIMLASLVLVGCGGQQYTSVSTSATPSVIAVTKATANPPVTPTVFISTSRDCLDELAIVSPELDQPEHLILRKVDMPGMFLYEQQLLRDITVSSDGMIRVVEWWFFPEPDEPTSSSSERTISLKGRFEPQKCVTWSIPLSLIDQLETALTQPAFLELHPSDVQPERTCPDYGGFVLISGSGSARKEIYVTECPVTNVTVGEVIVVIQYGFAYDPSRQ